MDSLNNPDQPTSGEHEGRKTRKVLLLGSGYVARPCAEYIVRDSANQLTIACRTLSSAEALASGLPNTSIISLDASVSAELEAEVAKHDLVVSLIPYTYHADVIKAAIKAKVHVVTTSYVSPAMRALDAEAKAAGIVVMNEIGVDPGIDHLYAIKTIGEVHAKGGKIKAFTSYCGGLPAPECATNPLGYKFSWSARGMILGLLNSASYLSNGKQVDVPGEEVMANARPYYISPAFSFVAYPNRNSVPFREFYGIPEAETVARGSLRYEGFPEFITALVKMGWIDVQEKEWLKDGMSWAEVMQKAIGAHDAEESALVQRVKELCAFPNEAEAKRIISGLKWIGLFSDEQATVRGGNLLDTLCAQLEVLMKYEEDERDLVMLQHRFDVQWSDGSEQTLTSTLEAYGEPGGHSAMARLVGIPCGIAVQFVLDGVIATPGVHAPYTKELCDPLRAAVEAEGLGMVEGTL